MSIAEEIAKLEVLHNNGTLTDEEFAKAKSAVIDGQTANKPLPVERPSSSNLPNKHCSFRSPSQLIAESRLLIKKAEDHVTQAELVTAQAKALNQQGDTAKADFLLVKADEELMQSSILANQSDALLVRAERIGRIVFRISVGIASIVAIAFGIFGLFDEAMPGLLTGIIVGGMVSFFTSSEISQLVIWVFSSKYFQQGASILDSHPVSTRTRIWNTMKPVLSLSFFLVMCHEAYWFINAVSSTNKVNVSYTILDSLRKNKSREFIKNELGLSEDRWALPCTNALPLRWCLTEENLVFNQIVLDLVDVVNGDQPKRIRLLDQHKAIKIGLHLLLEKSDTAR